MGDPGAPDRVELLREGHAAYLRRGLHWLLGSYEALDASRPRLCHWIVHSLTLLGEARGLDP